MEASADVPLALQRPSNQRALREIARDVLGREVGSRLATGADYQERSGVGAGTVQKALRALAAGEAVTLRPRGHRGTYIVERDVGRLWQVAGLGPVRVLLTPPGADEHHGLVAGLEDAFRRLGVPMTIGYLGGAEQRAREVADGRADVAVMSRGAAGALQPGTDVPGTVVDLGADTYYRPDSMLVVERDRHRAGQRGPLRVGIDRSSHDHERLTMAEFPEDGGHTYVDCEFPRVPAAILEDRIDLGIWHELQLLIPLHLVGLATRPLSTGDAIDTRRELSPAVLLADSGRAEMATLLHELDVTAVRETQDSLLRSGPGADRLRARRWGQ